MINSEFSDHPVSIFRISNDTEPTTLINFTNSQFRNNRAKLGAVLYLANDILVRITDSTFMGNSATRGSVLYSEELLTAIANNTGSNKFQNNRDTCPSYSDADIYSKNNKDECPYKKYHVEGFATTPHWIHVKNTTEFYPAHEVQISFTLLDQFCQVVCDKSGGEVNLTFYTYPPQKEPTKVGQWQNGIVNFTVTNISAHGGFPFLFNAKWENMNRNFTLTSEEYCDPNYQVSIFGSKDVTASRLFPYLVLL